MPDGPDSSSTMSDDPDSSSVMSDNSDSFSVMPDGPDLDSKDPKTKPLIHISFKQSPIHPETGKIIIFQPKYDCQEKLNNIHLVIEDKNIQSVSGKSI